MLISVTSYECLIWIRYLHNIKILKEQKNERRTKLITVVLLMPAMYVDIMIL